MYFVRYSRYLILNSASAPPPPFRNRTLFFSESKQRCFISLSEGVDCVTTEGRGGEVCLKRGAGGWGYVICLFYKHR